jgi:hypothetical protein
MVESYAPGRDGWSTTGRVAQVVGADDLLAEREEREWGELE